MNKEVKTFFSVVLAAALVLGLLSAPALAESNTVVGGPATAKLDFQINIPTILFLQVGSPGATVDLVSCTLSTIPGTAAAMTSSVTNPVQVRASAVVTAGAQVTLAANSSTPLGGAGGIPFSEISCTAGGGFTSYTFNNGAAQGIENWTGPGNRTGTWAFTYANANYYPTGTYNGTVTYTLSSP